MEIFDICPLQWIINCTSCSEPKPKHVYSSYFGYPTALNPHGCFVQDSVWFFGFKPRPFMPSLLIFLLFSAVDVCFYQSCQQLLSVWLPGVTNRSRLLRDVLPSILFRINGHMPLFCYPTLYNNYLFSLCLLCRMCVTRNLD